ncbi:MULTISPECIES: RepB family plasmid replication initiator protein [Leuconostoc]|nr:MULTISPECIES: RepB family plasmid replication initiator protein [Leuconostoc]MCJ2160595.1 RepB family plasmid replication initiator protein [Leuconostoc mesenteroides]MCM6834463.1 RepB family plasmid replication initiator protein [Leuconostoc mesenteroides]MDM7642215.1 RepB family plasmid replication initiator protein [Leuconostoc citreum]
MSIITESKTRQVQTLSELPKRKVVEHNSLITSIAKMDKTPLKMFELAVSLIDTENPPKDQTVYLSKQELFAFFNVDDSNKHSRFKEAIEKMQKQAFFKIKKAKEKGYEFESIVPIPYVKWADYHDEVTIRFSPEIMPYLINLKTNFTQHALSEISELNSKYAIILYRWLSMNYNQYEHYSVKGGRREEQVESYCNPIITIRELRDTTDTVSEYKKFTDFERRVLKDPIKEITNHTSFNVTYEKVKKGRSIESIVFHISKNQVADDISYKLDDPVVADALVHFNQGIQQGAKATFEGIFDDMDLASSRLGSNTQTRTKTLMDWISLIDQIELDEDADVLGDLYEYLIGMFAANSGAKAGEFYTPHQVSDIMARILTAGREDMPTYSSMTQPWDQDHCF